MLVLFLKHKEARGEKMTVLKNNLFMLGYVWKYKGVY